MNDREKVIKGLESHAKGARGCQQECPYGNENGCQLLLCADALALLKHKDKMFHALEDDWIRLKELLKKQEVVRCKDCKHGGCRTQNMDGSIFRVVCKKHSTKRNERWMDADWFCADGERKEGR